jgi:2-methylfumaryl-CoA hydratase
MTSDRASVPAGNFFEDFRTGQTLEHGPPRTLSEGDAALYAGLYGARFAPQAAKTAAQWIGLDAQPLDDLLVFHTVFGKTVPEVSLNAVANLGYAEARFLRPVFAGATLNARSEVIGLKENANRQTGVVYVRTTGLDQDGAPVLRYVRWVMVRKRDPGAAAPPAHVPVLAEALQPAELEAFAPRLRPMPASFGPAGPAFADYRPGQRIDHVDGTTVEEAEHMLATRLYHNTARVHFNQHAEASGRFGKRIVYGGHVISVARALSFNGLANAWFLAGINGGRHVAPCFAGDTIFAWTQVLAVEPAPGRADVGFLRLRTIATKNQPCDEFPAPDGQGVYPSSVILDLDYWAACPV